MVDLHTHTDESDGSHTPAELVELAQNAGLHALAITDHDTFAGYEKAVQPARERGLRLIRGIELNTRHVNRSVHLLSYFPDREPAPAFLDWLRELVAARRERNRRLIDKLRELGVDITLAEVETLGRTLTGRPHFARILVEKGYAQSRERAFSDFIGETGRAFVERESPTLFETIQLVAEAGGISSLAHPVRLSRRDAKAEERFFAGLRDAGLPALEVYHWDHSAADIAHYQSIADRYGFAATGGSDFHGSYKPGVVLGYAANGTIPIPDSAVAGLRAR